MTNEEQKLAAAVNEAILPEEYVQALKEVATPLSKMIVALGEAYLAGADMLPLVKKLALDGVRGYYLDDSISLATTIAFQAIQVASLGVAMEPQEFLKALEHLIVMAQDLFKTNPPDDPRWNEAVSLLDAMTKTKEKNDETQN